MLKATEFALILLLVQAAETERTVAFLRGQREGAKIVLNHSIAGLFGSCNYIFVLTICFDFRRRHLVEVFVLWSVVWLAATALVRCIAQFDVVEARVLVR